MTIRDQQRERLRRTIDWARKIEEHLAVVRERHLGEVHFRPSSTAISMIGLRRDRPQRGKSSITNLASLAANFDQEFSRHCIECEQGRATPEKRLQSYLLGRAYRSARSMTDLHVVGEEPLLFITDELSLPTDGGRIVCDLLALRGATPVVIELKPGREMTRLVNQVSGYGALIEDHLDLFSELFSAVLARPVTLQAPAEKWIVWPHPPGHDEDPRSDELAQRGIRVVGYTEVGDGFVFRMGRAPSGDSSTTVVGSAL